MQWFRPRGGRAGPPPYWRRGRVWGRCEADRNAGGKPRSMPHKESHHRGAEGIEDMPSWRWALPGKRAACSTWDALRFEGRLARW